MRINYVFAVIIIATHIGCASTRFVVDVSSIKVDNNIGKKVFVAPGNNVSINDVQFIEYSGYVKKALVKNGFTLENKYSKYWKQ